jgi:hypothetical protein
MDPMYEKDCCYSKQLNVIAWYSGDKAAAAANKEATKKWRAALVAARPEVPVAQEKRRKGAAHDAAVDLHDVEDLEDPLVAEEVQVRHGSDEDRFDDAGAISFVHACMHASVEVGTASKCTACIYMKPVYIITELENLSRTMCACGRLK